ncbi:helix-turn-helix transcriptional regulator (plasmid) [Paenibacillus peoriae]|uniref:helix-turn-helix domain-containing protein n=1 Tax=Paenibacillus peoriae TaxID=59893 RepID=UPI0032AEDC6E
MESFGQYLKLKRIERGFRRQSDLSDECWLDQGHLSKIESSQSVPNNDTIFILCRALDVGYLEMIIMAHPENKLTYEEEQYILNIEETDQKLESLLIQIYYRIIIERDRQLQIIFLEFLTKELDASQAEAARRRIEDYITDIDKHPIAKDEFKNELSQKNSKRESTRLFHLLVRKGYFEFRRGFLGKLQDVLSRNEETNVATHYDLGKELGEVYVDDILMTRKERIIAAELIRSLRRNESDG